MNNIFISTSSFGEYSSKPIKILRKSFNVKLNDLSRKLNVNELIDRAQDSIGIIAGTEVYDLEVFDKLPLLKVISRVGIGTDNIDINLANKKGVKIYKTHTTPAPAVAELALGLIINVARRISSNYNNLKAGDWNKEMGVLLKGKTLGIIGLGKIGKELAELTKGFNFKVLAFDKNLDEDFAKINNISYCDLDTLLTNSDIISIHLDLSINTNKLINKNKIDSMKNNAILINTSRGEIIDEGALYNALKSNHIYGAGLDVFKNEPYFGNLRELDNVVLTPHIASYASEIRVQMEMEAVENIIEGLDEI